MEIFSEALVDTGKLLPFLAIIYVFVGFLEYRCGDRMNRVVQHLGVLGPVIGALLGCVPQCGFSVVAAALYVKRLVSPGTLLAVFLSTSDEAIPVLLSMPDKAGMVGLLIVIKVVIAVVAGAGVDAAMRCMRTRASGTAIPDTAFAGIVEVHAGCCSHKLDGRPSKLKALLLHPLFHTLKISAFLLILTVLFNFLIDTAGPERIGVILLNGTIFQPVLASFIGLIPNCFGSVLLAELYAKGSISFGAMVAGLCAGGGLGILVLLKENKDLRNTLFIIGLLLFVSVLAGSLIQLVAGL
jgi:hypothetical protein